MKIYRIWFDGDGVVPSFINHFKGENINDVVELDTLSFPNEDNDFFHSFFHVKVIEIQSNLSLKDFQTIVHHVQDSEETKHEIFFLEGQIVGKDYINQKNTTQVDTSSRLVIPLTSNQHRDIVVEDGYEDHKGNWIDFKSVSDTKVHEGSGRHQEYWSEIKQRKSDNKFFKVSYSTSTQDMMDWEDCNIGSFELTEVFEKSILSKKYI